MVEHTRLQQLDRVLRGRELVIVSNREPYTHRSGPDGVVAQRPIGGLVAALDPVMQLTAGTWIAWGDGDADFVTADADARIQVPCEAPRYTLKRIALSAPEVSGYYHGYANQVLWPLCHVALDKVRLRGRYWKTYQAVNRRFADAVAAAAPRGAIVWLHDYHLATCARALRSLRSDLFLMQFWHVPWPAWDVFRICPERAELLDGLLANDLLTFQHPRHAAQFVECARRELNCWGGDNEIEYAGRRTSVRAFPISVDVAALDDDARSSKCRSWMEDLRRLLSLDGRQVVLSVDRLDYTKGVLGRLRAIELLLTQRPEYRSRVVFVQKMAASRGEIQAYRDLRGLVEARIARINVRYGTSDWRPVVYLPDPLPPAGMAALYRMADVCLVTPVADGMNLVAKEFIACQPDAAGVLLLSEFAGAHDELTGAVSINPYDADACAAAIARALQMPAEERRQRMDHLRTRLIAHDVYHWMNQHLETAARLLDTEAPAADPTREAIKAVRHAGSGAQPLAVFLDFDGTLAPFDDDPGRVVLSDATRAMLTRLSARPDVLLSIVSGRRLADLRRRIGLSDVVYAGNHGLEIEGRGLSWVLPGAECTRAVIEECGRRLGQRLDGIPGARIEGKGLTLTVHYRRTPRAFVERVRDAVFEESAKAPPGRVTVHLGTHAFELRPGRSWNKGAAVRKILTEMCGESWLTRVCVVYIGDDWTDEDVFLALPYPAITVKVGRHPDETSARYRVADVPDVHRILRILAALTADRSRNGNPVGVREARRGPDGVGLAHRNGARGASGGPVAAAG